MSLAEQSRGLGFRIATLRIGGDATGIVELSREECSTPPILAPAFEVGQDLSILQLIWRPPCGNPTRWKTASSCDLIDHTMSAII